MAKKEITIEEFRNLVKEEAEKLMAKNIEESYEEGEQLDELFGNKFKKAKNAFIANNKDLYDKMQQAYKSYNVEAYSEATDQLKKLARQQVGKIAKQYGIKDKNDVHLLYKDLNVVAEPMDLNTFKKQAQKGGASFTDVASGAGSGRKGWTGGKNEGKQISIDEFRSIVREEALKFKKKVVLENEKKALQAELEKLNSNNK